MKVLSAQALIIGLNKSDIDILKCIYIYLNIQLLNYLSYTNTGHYYW